MSGTDGRVRALSVQGSHLQFRTRRIIFLFLGDLHPVRDVVSGYFRRDGFRSGPTMVDDVVSPQGGRAMRPLGGVVRRFNGHVWRWVVGGWRWVFVFGCDMYVVLV